MVAKTYVYDGAKRAVSKVYVYDVGSVKRQVQKIYVYDPTKRQVFSNGFPNILWNFNGPAVSGTGDGGNGALYSIAPYPIAPRGSLSLVSGTFAGSVIGMHWSATPVAPHAFFLTMSVAGPDPLLVGRQLYVDNVRASISGTPVALAYMGAGFGGYYYQTDAATNLAVYANVNYEIGLRSPP
jgi:hypothetical protein